jgi:hypothetical protein
MVYRNDRFSRGTLCIKRDSAQEHLVNWFAIDDLEVSSL